VTSIACQCLGVQIETLTCLHVTIQMMNFFLCTAFGNSTGCYGTQNSVLSNPLSIPLQGSCRGNGGALAYFFALCIALVHVMYLNGHIAVMVRAISGSKV
jgi:hypothetical protein